MRPEPATITLGDRTWTVRPLTLRQLEILEPIIARGATAGNVAYGLAVLGAAIGRDHPDDVPGLPDIEAAADELAAATRTILILGGYIAEPGPGESVAVSSAASTSSGSTGASLQDAATPSA